MAQTYRCDVCNEVAGDFMLHSIATSDVTCIGVECLALWTLPTVAGWLEHLIDTGAEVPDWAPIVLDAHRQLAEMIYADAEAPPTVAETEEAISAAEEADNASPGRREASPTESGPTQDSETVGAAADVKE